MDGNNTVSISNGLFSDQVGEDMAIINPKSGFGVCVLRGIALKLFHQCQQKTYTVSELISLLNISMEEMQLMLSHLYTAGIIKITDYRNPLLCKKPKPKKTAIWLHVTNRCNLCCPYCYINKSNEDMSWDVAQKILDRTIDDCDKYGYDQLLVKFAGREPLLRFAFLEKVVEYVKLRTGNSALSVKFMLITNGTLITDRVADFLQTEKVGVAISMDGIGKFNDKTRIFINKSGSFQLIEQGITKLQSRSISPSILTVISDSNAKGLLDLTKFCIERNLRFSFTPVRAESDNWCDRDRIFCESLKSYYDYMENMILQGTSVKHSFENVNIKRKPTKRPCAIGANAITTDHKGDLFLCQAEIGKNNLCNINNIADTFLAIQSQKQIDLNVFSKECAECLWSGACAGGCPLLRQQIYKDLFAKSPYCSVYKLVIRRMMRLEAMKLQMVRKEMAAKGGEKAYA